MPAIRVEVVYALPGEQVLIALEVGQGTTALQALEHSGLLRRYPEIDPAGPIGIFGRVTDPDTPLRDGDRVEIYRSLLADPKDARRARARRR